MESPSTIFSGEFADVILDLNVDDLLLDWSVAAEAGQADFDPESDLIGPFDSTQQAPVSTIITLSDTNSPAEIIFTIIPITGQGCIGDTVFDTIRVNPRGIDIFIPEIFTPNGDDFKEVWQIQWAENINIEDYQMFVFNRSGGLVFRMDPVNDMWNGDSLPDGVYWWKMIHKPTGDVTTGGVTIVRKRL